MSSNTNLKKINSKISLDNIIYTKRSRKPINYSQNKKHQLKSLKKDQLKPLEPINLKDQPKPLEPKFTYIETFIVPNDDDEGGEPEIITFQF